MRRSFRFVIPVAGMVVFLGMCVTRIQAGDDDATAVALGAAKDSRDAALKDADTALSNGLGETVKKIAATGKLDATKAAISAKDQFDKWHLVPHSALMAEPVREYLKMREAANAKLIAAYDDAEASYTKQLKIDAATATRTERATFIASEKNFARSFGGAEKVAGNPQNQPAAKPPKAIDTGEYLKAFSTELHAKIDQIAKMDTSAKRDDAHKAMIHDLDATLQTKTLTLKFPIKDVQHAYNGQLTYSLGMPDEMAKIAGTSRYMSELTTDSTADVSKIKPGDLLIVSGTPRFSQEGYEDYRATAGTISPLSLVSSVTNGVYAVRFQNYKLTIEHK